MSDVLIVGSGPCGTSAAYPLVAAGKQVTMLDVGNVDTKYAHRIPERSFMEIRTSEEDQHCFFLGDDYEGITLGDARVGAQLTPPRMHITRDVERLMPTDSHDFEEMESLALGGLGAGWGAGVFPFTERDLRDVPGLYSELVPHYKAVAERIGVTGDQNLAEFFGDLGTMLAPLEMDTNAEVVFAKYARRRKAFAEERFFLGRCWLAVCTECHRNRGPHQYLDMDFWADDGSVYRPKWTVEELNRYPNFRYIDGRFVLSFKEIGDGAVEVTARNLGSGDLERYRASYLIVTANTLSTTRIVLRSLSRYDTKVPILCNPYSYAPVINIGMIGRNARDRRYSLAQLTAIYEPGDNRRGPVQAQYFSYRSLLTYKLLKEVPLPFRESLRMMRCLMPAIGILGINQEDSVNPARYCVFHREDGAEKDKLEICGGLTPEEQAERDGYDRTIMRFFRRLGCRPLKRIVLPQGASIHYAGTLPITLEEKDLTCDWECRLRGTRRVYIADGSILPYLPAKGLTFTIMANASRVASVILRRLRDCADLSR